MNYDPIIFKQVVRNLEKLFSAVDSVAQWLMLYFCARQSLAIYTRRRPFKMATRNHCHTIL